MTYSKPTNIGENIKIGKITVWNTRNGNGENGNSSTANFVSGVMKTVSSLNGLFNMAGLSLPSFLKDNDKTEAPKDAKNNRIEVLTNSSVLIR